MSDPINADIQGHAPIEEYWNLIVDWRSTSSCFQRLSALYCVKMSGNLKTLVMALPSLLFYTGTPFCCLFIYLVAG
jgi:hypothetical protein